jgi:PAS domain S-box-containing protein
MQQPLLAPIKPAFILSIFILLIALSWPGPARAQGGNKPTSSPLILTDEQGQYPLGLHLEILEDPAGQLTIEQVASPEYDGRFVPSQNEVPNFGYTNSAYWVRFRTRNETSQTTDWRLELGFANMQHVALYTPLAHTSGSGPAFAVRQTGTFYPFNTRDEVYHHFVFKLSLPRQAQQTLYLRFENGASMTLPLTLWSLEAFAQKSRSELFIWGVFYGILLIMIGYNAFLFLSLRDKNYLYYVLFITAFLLFQASFAGHAQQYLWPNLVGWNRFAVPFFSATAVMTALIFTASFLGLRARIPKLNRAWVMLQIVWGLLLLLTLFVSYRLIIRPIVVLVILSFLLMLGSGFVIWRQGYRPARFYALSWTPFLASIIVLALVRFGLAPSATLTEQSYLMSAVLMVLLLSLALADRINLLKAETDQANRGLQESERRLNQFLDALPVGMAVRNASTGVYQYANQRARQLLNLPPQGASPALTATEAVETLSLYIAGTEQPYPADRLPSALALQGQRVQVDNIEVEQAGRRISLEAWASPIFDEQGQIQYAISAFQDITERRQLEEQLKVLYQQQQSYAEQLEQRVAERTAELRQSQALLQALVDNAPAGILVKDRQERYILVNQRAAFWSGYTPEQMFGQTVADLFSPTVVAATREHEAQVLTTSQPIWREIILSSPTGPRTYSTIRFPIHDEVGEFYGLGLIYLDITERKQVEESLRFQTTLLTAQNEATRDGILVVSQAREWLFVNQQFLEMWGIPAEVAQSRSSRLALQQVKDEVLDPDQFLTTVEHLYLHPDLEIQDEVALKDGRIFDRYSAPVRSTDGVYYGRAWYYRDITERKRAGVERAHLFQKQRRIQKALRKVNAQLGQRIEELTVLNYIAQRVATGADLKAALAFAAEAITQHFNAFSTGISLFNETRAEQTLVAMYQVRDQEKLDFVGQLIPITNQITDVINQGRSFVIPDPQTSPHTAAYHQFIQEWNLQCLMLVPLQTRGEIIGAIVISTNQVGRMFTEAEVKLAETISGQIAGVIENARLFEAERRQRQMAESLREVAMSLNRSLEQETVLTTIMEQLGRVIRYDSGSIFLQEGDDLVMSKGRNVAKRFVGHRIPLTSANPSVRVFKQEQPLIITDVDTDPHWQMISDNPIQSWMGVPLVIGQKVIGVLTADSFEVNTYTEEDAQILQTFANQAAVAIENAQLYQQAQQAAAAEERNRLARNLHDSVTQALFSASLVAEVLPQIWQRDPDEARQGLEELRRLTKGALAEMRTLLLELRPKALLQARLDDLLQQLSQALASQTPIQVIMETEPAPALPPEVQLTLYRIAQETFNNIIKHAADATQVTVNLHISPPLSPNQAETWQGRVALSICDNGRGFDPNHIAPDKLGLNIMRERARDIGATLNIESQPGQGTEVRLIWQDSWELVGTRGNS